MEPEWSRNGECVSAIDDELARARGAIRRYTPVEAFALQGAGALIVDIRDSARRLVAGSVPGALELEMTVVEWRLDTTCEWVHPDAADPARPVLLLCNEGYSSSLTAERIQRLGRPAVGDVIGGFEAWAADGLPRLGAPRHREQRPVDPSA